MHADSLSIRVARGMLVRVARLAGCLTAFLVLSVASTIAFGQEVLAMSRYNQRDPNWVGEIDLVREHFKLDQDQLMIVRTITSGTMHEYLMQRRVYDRRREDYEAQEQTPRIKTDLTAENLRFAKRRAAMELDWLTQVRDVVLTDVQRQEWNAYERARRVQDVLHVNLSSTLQIGALLKDLKLSPEELAAIEPSIESGMETLDSVARKWLDATGKWLQVRWGAATGDLDQLQTLQQQAAQPLAETLRKAVRTIAGSLPLEKGDEFRTKFEVLLARNEMVMTNLVDSFPFDRVVKISSLSSEQQDQLKKAIDAGNETIYKRVIKFTEERNANRVANNEDADYQVLLRMRGIYEVDERKIKRDTYAAVLAILTPEQRKAWEEGLEPPIDSGEVMDHYNDEDEMTRRYREFND